MSVISGNTKSTGGAAYRVARSLRLRATNSAKLSRAFTTPTNANIWTFSTWFKLAEVGTSNTCDIFAANGTTQIQFEAASRNLYVGYTSNYTVTNMKFLDPTAWMHLCVTFNSGNAATSRCKIYVNGSEVTYSANAYQATNAINTAVTHYIGTFASSFYFDGNVAETYFIDGQELAPSYFTQTDATTNQLVPKAYTGTYGINGCFLKYDDNSGITVPTIGKDSSGANILSVTGNTATSTSVIAISGSVQPQINQVVTGSGVVAGTYVTAVGGLSGAWTATLNQATSSSLTGTALVFTGNNWTPTGISITAGITNDSVVDSPTNYGTDAYAGGEVRGNYAKLSPLYAATSSLRTLTNANDTVSFPSGTNLGTSIAPFILNTTNRHYFEMKVSNAGAASYGVNIAVVPSNQEPTTGSAAGAGPNEQIYSKNGNKYINGTGSAYGATYTTGDVIGLDWNAGTVTAYKNGATQGTLASGLTGDWHFQIGGYGSGAVDVNFGQRPWHYAPPSGSKACCTQNIATPAVVKPKVQFDAALYTGNGTAIGSGGKAVSTDGSTANNALQVAPDLVWIKGRSAVTSHGIYDNVRGTTKDWASDLTTDETTQTEGLTTFGTTGFTVGSLAKLNTNLATYAAWLWKMGGAGVAGSGSGLTSLSQSVNATAGQSVITYTGHATAGDYFNHGLGVAPGLVIIKERVATDAGAIVWHSSLANTEYLVLQTSAAKVTGATTLWNSTTPNTTKVTLSTSALVNESAGTYVAYVFAPVAGYSKFGSYTGTAAADGPVIDCGFKPRWILIKRIDGGTEDWLLVDTLRSPINPIALGSYADTTSFEFAYTSIDVLSNGFKIRTASSPGGASGTYIYAAFADVPGKYARAA